MAISYSKLFALMKERNMTKTDLRNAIGIGQNTLAKIGKNEYVSMEVLVKICEYFNCNIGDVIDVNNSKEVRDNA